MGVQLLETHQVCTSEMSIVGEVLRKMLGLKGLQLADMSVYEMENMKLGILIGGDHYWQMVTGLSIERLRGDVAIESIQGSDSLMNVAHDVGVMKVITEDDRQLSHQVREFWEIEALGIESGTENKMSQEEKEALQFFQETVKETRRYQVRLPGREIKSHLSSNLTITDRTT